MDISGPKHKRHRLNVVGPFYVEDQCCTACGVPEWLAPTMFGEGDDVHCYVKRQPENEADLDAMMNVMVTQDLGCVRYAGTDENILRRLAENDEAAQCDVQPPLDARPVRRDHVVFATRAGSGPWTARLLLERLIAFGAKYRSTAIFDDGMTATVSVSWFEDNYHRIELRPSHVPNEWVVRRVPGAFSDTIDEWLTTDDEVERIGWQSVDEWKRRGPMRSKPW